MLHRLSAAALAALLLPACLTAPEADDDLLAADLDAADDDGFAPPLSTYDEIFPEGRVVVAPDPAPKAVLPKKFDLVALQTPVKNQASRGVCSIFASAALVEHLYKKAGIPALDLSEQYLHWSAKAQLGSFTNTDGSNNMSNLRAVNRFGVPTEDAWAYETTPWTAANDPACAGENKPIICYTNGEPPASALAPSTFKIKAPSPRSMSADTLTIKNHLANTGTAVAIGVEFFYQSWNHRTSRLVINNERLRQGIVTNPNGDDERDSSGDRRAGHAVLIVGWDDDLEVPLLDKDGNPRVENGVAVVDKGFFIIKNSWGTGRFGIENPHGAGYGFISYEYVRRFADAVRVEVPTIQAERCDLATGDEDLDGLANCDDSACATAAVCQSGPTEPTEPGVYSATPNASIPDNSTTGASSTITITDAGVIATLQLALNITHPYVGDLNVTLSNGTTTFVVHANTGGSADNIVKTVDLPQFVGQALAGTWTLKAIDSANADVGTLNSWSLTATTR